MNTDCKDALALALGRGIAGEPQNGSWFFYNAAPLPGLSAEWKKSLICVQHFRPHYLDLEKEGYPVFNKNPAKQESVRGGIFLLGRNRIANQKAIADLWEYCGKNARLIVAGDKKSGISSIRKWFAGHVKHTDSFFKFHATVFWSDRQEDHTSFPEFCTQTKAEGYLIPNGTFSSGGPDAGSRLLAGYFDRRIKGKVADLGAGWGYLCGELLKKSEGIKTLDLFEADHVALTFAQKNLQHFTNHCGNFNWMDVTTETPRLAYEWVIMNPPFHYGRAARPDIGCRFIEVAASILSKNGRLLMVANRNLPYETTLTHNFRKIDTLTECANFKVIEAIR